MWAGCSSFAAPLKGVNTWCAVWGGREWQNGRGGGRDWKKVVGMEQTGRNGTDRQEWKNMVNCPGKMPKFTSQMAKNKTTPKEWQYFTR